MAKIVFVNTPTPLCNSSLTDSDSLALVLPVKLLRARLVTFHMESISESVFSVEELLVWRGRCSHDLL